MAIGPATSTAGPASAPATQNPAAQRLAVVAHTAYDTYSHDCSHSVWFVLKQIVDPNQPYMMADRIMASVKRSAAGSGRCSSRKRPISPTGVWWSWVASRRRRTVTWW